MASYPNAAEGGALSYVVDPARSRFEIRAFAMGMLSAFGHNPTIIARGVTGEAWFRAEAPETSSVRLAIDPDSLAIAGDVNDKDRREMESTMKEEVLETSRHREIRFESSGMRATKLADGMYRMQIAGKMTLHGVERTVEIPCTVVADENLLRANGEFSIRQTDYRIRPVSAAGGTIKLKDELKFRFDLVAPRRKEGGDGGQ